MLPDFSGGGSEAGLVFGSLGDLNLDNWNYRVVCRSHPLGMDTAFSKMAETWPHLLLLLSLFNPLLSLNLTNQNETGSMSTTNASTGALVPEVNPGGRRPVTNRQPTTTIKPTTTRGDQAPADKGGFPCSTPPSRRDGLVSQCLIAIAALAGVATIFIVSTIVLCTKLSSTKHRYRMNRDYGTEMVCISNLLPDGNGSHGRPRISKSNGALIPNLEDSDEDDLTLHSFLPETDRCS
ncbi:hypothetical protein SKAU_G00001560 [Synaphobranchus kaupii]|uniref:P-selectin glycoprotein ligand 1 n=1 Tax=Synaphobranchus kaupii TaxID=118154 RepID=A0A9Q1JBA5_SYNKA|nr:hypothetical protein SKAU_G00001560 [Synaphobranchus kaupii]